MAYTKEQWERWKREHPDEWRKRAEKIARSHKGGKLSEAHRRAIAKGMRGRRLSRHHKRHIAESVKRRHRGKSNYRFSLPHIAIRERFKISARFKSRTTAYMTFAFVLGMIFTLGLTSLGLFAQDDWAKHWENRKDITVDNNIEYVTTHVTFGLYKPERCEDGIMVTDGEQNVSFTAVNPVINNGVCDETDVRFYNSIFGPTGFQIAFIEPTPDDGTVITENNFTVKIYVNHGTNFSLIEWGKGDSTKTDVMAGFATEWFYDLDNLTDGQYVYRVFATDSDGNAVATGFRTVTISSGSNVTEETHENIFENFTANISENFTSGISENVTQNLTENMQNTTENLAQNETAILNETATNESQSNISSGMPTGSALEPPRATYYVYYGKKPAAKLTTISFEPPTPTDGQCVAQDWIYANATADSDATVAVLNWESYGTADSIAMSGYGTNWHYNLTGLAPGAYTLRIFAMDAENKTVASDALTVNLCGTNATGSKEIEFDKETYYAVPGETFTAKIKIRNPTDKTVDLTLSPAFDQRLKLVKVEKLTDETPIFPTGNAAKNGTAGKKKLTPVSVAEGKKIDDSKEYKRISPNLKKPSDFSAPTFSDTFGSKEEKEYYVTFQAPRQPGKGEFFFYALGDNVILAVDPWWNTNWSYSKNVTVTDSSGSALKYYDVRIVLDTASLIAAGKMQSGCADIRFANSSGNQIDYWLESNCSTTTTSIWIEVPNIPASGSETVSMYYGNPSAPTASNGNTTFPFFDDFPGTALDGTKWTATGAGSATVSGSILTLNADKYAFSNYIFAPNQEIVWNATASADGSYIYFGTSDDAFGSYMMFNGFYGYISNKAGIYANTVRSDALTSYRVWGIQWNTTANYFVNYGYKVQHGNTWTPAVNQKALARAFTASTNLKADWVFVRNITWPEPAYSVASTENTAANLTFSVTPATASVGGTAVAQANYTDSGGSTITGANCTLTVLLPGGDSESYVMPYNAGTGNYTYTYSAHRAGAASMSASCNGTDYSVLLSPSSILSVSGAWWDSQYQYRKNLTVINNGATNLYNYSIRTVTNTASMISDGKMQPNCSDLRFASSNNTNIDFWIESDCNSSAAAIWVEIPFIPASANETISMYYGNPAAYRNASNGDATFPLFDHFNMPSSALNTTKWTTDYAGQVTVANSIVTINGANGPPYADIYSVKQFSPGQDVEWNITSSVDGSQFLYFGASKSDITQYALIHTSSGFLQSNGAAESAARTNSISVYRRWSVLWNTTGSYFYADGSYDNKLVTYPPQVPLRAFALAYNPGYTLKADWLFVRNISTPEPTYAAKNEEILDSVAVSAGPASVSNGDNVTIRANYTNYTGGAINNANCTLTIVLPGEDTDVYNMSYNASSGNFTYNYTTHRVGNATASVTCNATGRAPTTSSNTFTVTGDWWDTQYQYRQNITVTNNGGTQLNNYDARATIDTASLISAGKMSANCSDMRFANSSGYYVDYWVEPRCNKADTNIWLEVPHIPASGNATISMYYKANASRSASDGDATFPFFDDFTGSAIDASKWNTVRGQNIIVSNGIVSLTGDSAGWTEIKSKTNFEQGQAIMWNATTYPQDHPLVGTGIYFGFGDGAWNYWTAITPQGLPYGYTQKGEYTAVATGSRAYYTNQSYIMWDVRWNSTGTHFYANHTYDNSLTDSNPSLPYPAVASAWTSGEIFKADWVFVRNVSTPEPSNSYGSEEPRLGAGAFTPTTCTGTPGECADGPCRSTPGGLKYCANDSTSCVGMSGGNPFMSPSQGQFPFAESGSLGYATLSGLRCYNGYWAYSPLKLNPNVTFAEYNFTTTASNASYSIKVPFKSYVSRADLLVTGTPYNGRTPYAPSLDAGNNGIGEWALDSPNMLYDNCSWGGGIAATQTIGTASWVAQSFTAPANSTISIISVEAGRPAALAGTETFIVEIRNNSAANLPDTALNARTYAMNVFGTALASTSPINITIPTELTPGGNYWIVIRGVTGGVNGDGAVLLSNQPDPSCSGTLYTSPNGGGNWNPVNGDMAYEIRDATNLTQALSPKFASLTNSYLSDLRDEAMLGCSCTGCSRTDNDFYCSIPINASVFYGGGLTLSSLRVEYLSEYGAICLDDRDCRSGYCRADYNGTKFCASNVTNCVFNASQNASQGAMPNYNVSLLIGDWWCDSGHWGRDAFSNTRNDTYVTLNFSTAGFDKTTNISINSSASVQSALMRVTGRANLTLYKTFNLGTVVWAVYSDSDYIYAGEQNNVHVISKSNWTDFKSVTTPAAGSPISIVSDEKNVYVASGASANLFVYRKSDWVRIQTLNMGNNIDSLAVDSKYVYTGSSDVRAVDKALWTTSYTLSTNDNGIAKSLATDDRYLYVGTNYGNITVYDKNKFEPQYFFAPTSGADCGGAGCAVNSMDSDYRYLYVADYGGSSFAINKEEWAAQTVLTKQKLGGTAGSAGTVMNSISADNKHVFIGDAENKVEIYDVTTWTNKRNLTEASNTINSVWRDDYGDWVYSASSDNNVRIYNWSYPKNPRVDVGLDQNNEWNYTGVFNQTAGSQLINFTARLQALLASCNCAGCKLGGGQCNISINVSSQSPGILELDQLDINDGTTGGGGGGATPTMENVFVDDDVAFPYNQLDLAGGTQKTVICNGTANDADGVGQLTPTIPTGVLFHSGDTAFGCTADNNNCYRNSTCGWLSAKNATAEYVECRFSVWFNAKASNEQLWTCNITVTDATSLSAFGTDTTDVNYLLAVGSPSLIAFGTMTPGTTSTSDLNSTIQNYGNVQIDLSLNGTNLSCGYGNISANYLHYNCTHYNQNYAASMSPLLSSLTGENCTGFNLVQNTTATTQMPIPSAKNLPWKIGIPSAVKGGCQGTIWFAAAVG